MVICKRATQNSQTSIKQKSTVRGKYKQKSKRLTQTINAKVRETTKIIQNTTSLTTKTNKQKKTSHSNVNNLRHFH